MRTSLGAIVLFACFTIRCFASTAVVPTTTLQAEVGNNTSAADSFLTQQNGNIGAGNVSKVSIRSLLYSGSTTPVYAHFMPWFGTASHMNVGYASADPVQVQKQVADLLSRGIQGVIIDWYGPGRVPEDTATQLIRQQAELYPGKFEFAVMEDQGALSSCANTAGCDLTAQLISDLTYVYNTYEISPAYMRRNGRPLIFEFGLENYQLVIDWSRVQANLPGNPIFVWQNAGGFTKPISGGAFSWVQPRDATAIDPMSLNYLNDFYRTALGFTVLSTFGTAYKGFNDVLAAWAPSPPRYIGQQCGQTWLTSMAVAGQYYNTATQLDAFQLVTWNDYEEGTELETGIDNCVSVSASLAGSALSWTPAGDESGVHHYTVFISSDGQNLMALGDFPAGSRRLELGQFGFPPGNYSLYVKAVGQPSMTNHMSSAVAFAISDALALPRQMFRVSVTPATASVQSGQSASFAFTVAPESGGSVGQVSFSCSNLPSFATCSFSPATLMPGANAATTSVTVATTVLAADAAPAPARRRWRYSASMGLLPAIVLLGSGMGQRKRRSRAAALGLLGLLALWQLGCGGAGKNFSSPASTTQVRPSASYTIMLNASSGAIQQSATVTVTLR